ncbi:MAG: hypothetical protein M0Z76_07905 [Gammaproteobacteria bacterium]|nr:hypothetical protein [Gammaproteobacteria bacterium]
MNRHQMDEFLCEAVETEAAGIRVYETALGGVLNADWREEWQRDLTGTRRHERVLRDICDQFGIDPGGHAVARGIVRTRAETLVRNR